MTTDATLHQDIRKMIQLIEALLTHGPGSTTDPVREMINDLSRIDFAAADDPVHHEAPRHVLQFLSGILAKRLRFAPDEVYDSKTEPMKLAA